MSLLSCSVILSQRVQLVIGDHNHGRFVASWGVGKLVVHEHTVHDVLVLGDEVVVGDRSQPTIRHHVWLGKLHLPVPHTRQLSKACPSC